MGLPNFEKLPLECALDDPPQLRTLTQVFSSDVTSQHEYLATLHRLTSKLVATLDDVTMAYQGMAQHMHSYTGKVYAINTDPYGLVETSLSKSAELMQEVSSWQHILTTQLTDGVLHPLTQQLNAFSQLQQLKDKHGHCEQALDSALATHLKVKRKDSDSDKQAATQSLTEARRNFHQCSVLYYNELNLHQSGRQLTFLTPLLSLVAAHQCFHSLGHASLNANHGKRQIALLKEVMKEKEKQEGSQEGKEAGEKGDRDEGGEKQEDTGKQKEDEVVDGATVASKADTENVQKAAVKSSVGKEVARIPRKNDEDYYEALGLVVKRLETELELESSCCSDVISALLDHSEQLYCPSSAATVHTHQAHPHALHGYLNVNKKYMGVMSTWDRCYVFVEGGHLMGVWRGEVAGGSLLPLSGDVVCRAGEEDRSNVFTVASGKRTVTLQALTSAERDIWMGGLTRAGRDGSFSSAPPLPSPARSLSSLPSLPSPSSPTASVQALLGTASTATGGFLSSMTQFLSSKLHNVSLATATATANPGQTTYTCPRPRQLSPLKERAARIMGGGGAVSSAAPIVFDLGPLQGAGEGGEGAGQTFDAAFLGSMPVNVATGPSTVITEVIRRVMSARAHHDVFSSSPVVITVAAPLLTVRSRRDVTEHPGKVRHRHLLTSLTGWCTHQENPRLFGYVVRGVSSLQAFVFQCDEDASRVCRAITIADDPHSKEKERSLILANIAQLEDGDIKPSQSATRRQSNVPGEVEEAMEEFDGMTEEQLREMEAEMGM